MNFTFCKFYFFEGIAFDKGYDSDAHAFAMCFWLGIFGYIYVACLPDLKLQQLQDISEAIITNKEDVA